MWQGQRDEASDERVYPAGKTEFLKANQISCVDAWEHDRCRTANSTSFKHTVGIKRAAPFFKYQDLQNNPIRILYEVDEIRKYQVLISGPWPLCIFFK